MEIIPTSRRLALLDYIGLLRYRLSEWLIVEVKLTMRPDMLSADIARILNELFPTYEGRILICSQTDVLMLIEWGKDNNPNNLVKKVQRRLPEDSCEVAVVPSTKEGLKKIELLIAPPISDYGPLHKARMARRTNVFLIADDDMYMRLLAKKGLQELGDVIEVGDGSQVLDIYKTHNPDLILLDIHMPGLSGQEILNQLKKIDPRSFVIMLSADSSRENVQWAHQHGASGFLAKPFNKAKL